MTALFLDKIDSAPIAYSKFEPQFLQWLWTLVDSLNESLADIETAINLFTAQNLTATQITDMFSAGTLTNGVIVYDSTNDEYVGVQAGALVKFTTTPYP